MPPTKHTESVSYRRDRSYFSALYDDSVRHGPRRRRFERIFACSLLLFGVYTFSLLGPRSVLPYVLIAAAISQFFFHELVKYFWLRRQLRSAAFGSELTIALTPEGFSIKSASGQTAFRWDEVAKIVRTPTAFMLWMDCGVLRLPLEVLSAEVVDLLASRVK